MANKKEETNANYRQWKVDDLTDDENVKENQTESKRTGAFEKFIAQHKIAMTPPSVQLENINLTEIKKPINSSVDNNKRNRRSRVPRAQRRRRQNNFLSQRPVSTSSLPVLTKKVDPPQTQPEIIELVEDDDDNNDFVQSVFFSSSKSYKRLKLK